MARNITIETIISGYSRCRSGGFTIVMDSNGYINATDLCTRIAGRDFARWRRTRTAATLVNGIAATLGLKEEALLHTPTNLSEGLAGTYAHPDLIIHIVAWADPRLIVVTERILKEYVLRQERKKISELVAEVSILRQHIGASQCNIAPTQVAAAAQLGCVYFIRASGNPTDLQIGFTTGIHEGPRTIHLINHQRLLIVDIVVSEYSEKLEALSHELFDKYQSHDGWFSVDDELLAANIEKLKLALL